MGTTNKNAVQLVISHLEGCSGNFLGRLYADQLSEDQTLFRVDTNQHPQVLSIDGYEDWPVAMTKFKDQIVVVTHNFDLELLAKEFPRAKLVQIYPYTHIGNVLYNVCFKKLDTKIANVIDNHLIHISQWYQRIVDRRPDRDCTDYWILTDKSAVEKLLGIELSPSQHNFFDRYWQQQLPYELSIPTGPQSIEQLLELWNFEQHFDEWSVAWTIFVYELVNGLAETTRLWSIDTQKFVNWADVIEIQTKYSAQ